MPAIDPDIKPVLVAIEEWNRRNEEEQSERSRFHELSQNVIIEVGLYFRRLDQLHRAAPALLKACQGLLDAGFFTEERLSSGEIAEQRSAIAAAESAVRYATQK